MFLLVIFLEMQQVTIVFCRLQSMQKCVCLCVCVCVDFISLHHMRACLFFFLNNISSHTRWWSERNVWSENKFYFSFQITLPKDMVISLGSIYWNWLLWHPSSSSLHQVESKDEKINSKEIKKIHFLHIHNNMYVKVCSH